MTSPIRERFPPCISMARRWIAAPRGSKGQLGGHRADTEFVAALLWLFRSYATPAALQVDILPEHGSFFGQMSTQRHEGLLDLLQGTRDLLILRTLIFEAQHGLLPSR